VHVPSLPANISLEKSLDGCYIVWSGPFLWSGKLVGFLWLLSVRELVVVFDVSYTFFISHYLLIYRIDLAQKIHR
jgi:hypothetical protein